MLSIFKLIVVVNPLVQRGSAYKLVQVLSSFNGNCCNNTGLFFILGRYMSFLKSFHNFIHTLSASYWPSYSEAVVQRCSVKNGVLKNFAKLTGKHCVRVSLITFTPQALDNRGVLRITKTSRMKLFHESN